MSFQKGCIPYNLAKKVQITCHLCGAIKKVIPSKAKQRYCSRKCKDRAGHSSDAKKKMSIANTGKNNPNYGRTGIKHPMFGKRGSEMANFINDKTMHCGRWFVYADGKRIRRARYVVEQSIKQKLNSNDIVHHINEDVLDDRLENLYLFTRAEHCQQHFLKNPPILISNLIY